MILLRSLFCSISACLNRIIASSPLDIVSLSLRCELWFVPPLLPRMPSPRVQMRASSLPGRVRLRVRLHPRCDSLVARLLGSRRSRCGGISLHWQIRSWATSARAESSPAPQIDLARTMASKMNASRPRALGVSCWFLATRRSTSLRTILSSRAARRFDLCQHRKLAFRS